MRYKAVLEKASAIQSGVANSTESNIGLVSREFDKLINTTRRASASEAILEASEWVADNATALEKARRSADRGAVASSASLPPSDSAGVAIVKLAKDISNFQRRAAKSEAAQIIAKLRSEVLSPEDVFVITDVRASVGDSAINLANLRETLMRYFEAHIWVQLIWARPPNGKPRPDSPDLLFRRLELYVPATLLTYWTRRLIDPSNPDGHVFAGLYRLRDPRTGRILDSSGGAVGEYFLKLFNEALEKQTEKKIKNLMTVN